MQGYMNQPKCAFSCRSHHEKIVIVDYQICFIGGLDLCFGRYDTFEHKVNDHPPAIWPGKDYYNPRCECYVSVIMLDKFSGIQYKIFRLEIDLQLVKTEFLYFSS